MEIATIGKGKGSFKPDEMQIRLQFKSYSEDYQEALINGNNSIDEFVNKVLIGLGFNKEDLKFIDLTVREERKYNNQTGNNELIGYIFNGEGILKVSYDKDLIALFLSLMSKQSNPPEFTLNFGLKDEEKYKKELLERAYKDALRQAIIIANAANKEVKDTLKTSYEPLNEPFISSSSFSNREILYANESNNFINYLNPQNIEVEQVIYALFLAE